MPITVQYICIHISTKYYFISICSTVALCSLLLIAPFFLFVNENQNPEALTNKSNWKRTNNKNMCYLTSHASVKFPQSGTMKWWEKNLNGIVEECILWTPELFCQINWRGTVLRYMRYFPWCFINTLELEASTLYCNTHQLIVTASKRSDW